MKHQSKAHATRVGVDEDIGRITPYVSGVGNVSDGAIVQRGAEAAYHVKRLGRIAELPHTLQEMLELEDQSLPQHDVLGEFSLLLAQVLPHRAKWSDNRASASAGVTSMKPRGFW